MEKELKQQLRKYSNIFKDAQESGKKEADVVMYIVQFFQDALGYDILKKQEISREYATGGGFCDIAIKIEGKLELLIEVKQPGMKLADSHIRQVKNYVIERGMTWALLTNGCDWKLFHLRFKEEEGVEKLTVFETDLLESFQKKPDDVIEKFKLLHRKNFVKGELEKFWKKKLLLIPRALSEVLFKEDVLKKIRTEVNRDADVKVGVEDIAKALKNMFEKEVLADMAEIKIKKTKKSIASSKPKKAQLLN
jgi:predicted type IV restriction endonuclease